MDENSAQKKLGIYFAGINIASIAAGAVVSASLGLKEGMAVFLGSVILLTILVQSYANRKLPEIKE